MLAKGMSMVLLQPQCSEALNGWEKKEEERKKKTLRSADSVLHAIPKGPSESGGRVKKRKVKGVGNRKREKNSPAICGKRITQGLSVT